MAPPHDLAAGWSDEGVALAVTANGTGPLGNQSFKSRNYREAV